mgnify:CR=1 FL=1
MESRKPSRVAVPERVTLSEMRELLRLAEKLNADVGDARAHHRVALAPIKRKIMVLEETPKGI